MSADDRRSSTDGLRERTKRFALMVIHLSSRMPNTPEAWVIRRQICRCGTSVGAQYREACRARSRAEFVSKMESALQELDETSYWLELLSDAELASPEKLAPIAAESDELTRMFVASIKTAKRL